MSGNYNEYATAARANKVLKLTEAIQRLRNTGVSIPVDVLRVAGDDTWKHLEKLAEVNKSSPTTRGAVIEHLERMEGSL